MEKIEAREFLGRDVHGAECLDVAQRLILGLDLGVESLAALGQIGQFALEARQRPLHLVEGSEGQLGGRVVLADLEEMT